MNLYDDYLKMLIDAESFMKVHKIKMSGTDVKPGTGALVITKELLDKFAEKLKKADIIIDRNERRKKDLLEEKQNWEREAEAEKERMINYTLDMLRRAGVDNPYNVPEQSSSSDDAAFYFPFGRE